MSRRYWYFYTGYGDETDPYNYFPGESEWTEYCNTGYEVACAIYARPGYPDSSIPRATDFNTNAFGDPGLTTYLTLAKLFNFYYPLPPQKPYVYLRSRW